MYAKSCIKVTSEETHVPGTIDCERTYVNNLCASFSVSAENIITNGIEISNGIFSGVKEPIDDDHVATKKYVQKVFTEDYFYMESEKKMYVNRDTIIVRDDGIELSIENLNKDAVDVLFINRNGECMLNGLTILKDSQVHFILLGTDIYIREIFKKEEKGTVFFNTARKIYGTSYEYDLEDIGHIHRVNGARDTFKSGAHFIKEKDWKAMMTIYNDSNSVYELVHKDTFKIPSRKTGHFIVTSFEDTLSVEFLGS